MSQYIENHKFCIDSTDNVYVGGTFIALTDASSTSAKYVAKWNSTSWTTLGNTLDNGVNAQVNALKVDSNNNLYVGGTFAYFQGNYVRSNIGSTIGSSTTITLSGVQTPLLTAGMYVYYTGAPTNLVITTVTSETSIIVSSSVNIAPGTTIYFSNTSRSARRIAKWNGSSWSSLGNVVNNGVTSSVNTLERDSSNNIYVGGAFASTNGNLVTTNSTNTGVTNSKTITFTSPSSSTLTVGMRLYYTGLTNTEYLTIYQVVSQTSIIVDQTVSILANTTIYFSTSSISANSVAKWTPGTTTWSAVGGQTSPAQLNGIPTSCTALSINRSNDSVYASSSSTVYQLFSDYVNVYYNNILIRQPYLNGQTFYVYTNNTNGQKMCNVVSPTVSYQNYFT
jgi:hypothetical protein